MLSGNAFYLALSLREVYGPDCVGLGPDRSQLIDMWGDNDPPDLMPALRELKNRSFIEIQHGSGASQAGIDPAYDLGNIVSINITGDLLRYLDRELR